MSLATFAISSAALAVFLYTLNFILYDAKASKVIEIQDEALRKFGHFKFMTFQCLAFQILNAILHLGAHFTSFLKKPRDLVFGVLAYPVGSIVVYTFWMVWHGLGRDAIYPVILDQYYPSWVNHVIHSIIVPLNFAFLFLIKHEYFSFGLLFNLFYFLLYASFLVYVKTTAGVSVYPFLDKMGELERYVYYAVTGLIAIFMYKTGEYFTSLIHGKASQRPALKKSKQK